MSLKYWAGTVVLCTIKIPLSVNIWQHFVRPGHLLLQTLFTHASKRQGKV